MIYPSVAVVALTVWAASDTPNRLAEQPSYFPTRVGAKWTCGFPGADITFVVTDVEKKGGSTFVFVGQLIEGNAVKSRSVVEISDKGLFEREHAVTHFWLDGGIPVGLPDEREVHKKPSYLLKLPSNPGDEWADEAHPGARTTYKARPPERVKVPAGEFTTIPVNVTKTFPDGSTLGWRYWYAPGAGMVKWTYEERGVQKEIVMKSFSPGTNTGTR